MKSFLILLTGIILGGAAIWWATKNRISITPINPTPTQAIVDYVSNDPPSPTTEVVEETTNTGFVEGTINYPSEGIPNYLSVCAETTGGLKVKCTTNHIANAKYKTGVGYRLELDQGKYYVYANTGQEPVYKAYYNEFVTCGLLASCPSHKKIEVDVIAGQTTSNIDPADWYNN